MGRENLDKLERSCAMKKILMLLVAGAFVMFSASSSHAGMVNTDYTGLNAVDSEGLTVVAITAPSAPIITASHEMIYLDSNMEWSVADLSKVSSSGSVAAVKSGDTSGKNLYCFDSESLFCALKF